MTSWRYQKGLHQLGNQVYAYLQPNGSWGWSNAGLIADGDQSLLIDTLWDVPLTQEMLRVMKDVEKAAKKIDTVVNTHANGDHCWGNQVVRDAPIIASRRGAEEMEELTPKSMAALVKLAQVAVKIGKPAQMLANLVGALGVKKVKNLIDAAPYVAEIFSDFDFESIDFTPPTQTFDDALTLNVGQKKVELIEVGPAHTKGDVLVYCPDDKVLFSGDMLFIKGHPIIWEGPIENWIKACNLMLDLDVEAYIPGHGPITDDTGVRNLRDYLIYIAAESRKRYDAGMGPDEAALDIALTDYADWCDAERIVINVDTLYRSYAGTTQKTDVAELFARMAKIRKLM